MKFEVRLETHDILRKGIFKVTVTLTFELKNRRLVKVEGLHGLKLDILRKLIFSLYSDNDLDL